MNYGSICGSIRWLLGRPAFSLPPLVTGLWKRVTEPNHCCCNLPLSWLSASFFPSSLLVPITYCNRTLTSCGDFVPKMYTLNFQTSSAWFHTKFDKNSHNVAFGLWSNIIGFSQKGNEPTQYLNHTTDFVINCGRDLPDVVRSLPDYILIYTDLIASLWNIKTQEISDNAVDKFQEVVFPSMVT